MSMSRQSTPAGKGTAFMLRAAAKRPKAPVNVWSSPAAASRWNSKMSGSNTNAPQSIAGSGSSVENAVACPP